MFRRIIMALCLSALLSFAGENLLKNPDFQSTKEDGSFTGWALQPHTFAKLDGEWLTMGEDATAAGTGAIATIVQSFDANVLEGGKTYAITCLVKSESSSTVQIYVEGYYPKDGKPKGFDSDLTHKPVGVDPTAFRSTFTLPNGGPFAPIYLAIRVLSKNPAQISQIALTEVKRRPECGGFWEIEQYPDSPEDGILLHGGQIGELLSVPVEPGKQYRLSYEVTGKGKTGNPEYFAHEYQVVTEPYISGGIAFQDVLEITMPKSQILTIPNDENFTSIKKISFQSKTGGDLLFRKFRLEPYVRAPSEDWQFFLTEPCYRDTIFPRTDTGRIVGKIQATAPAVTAKIELKEACAPVDVSIPKEPELKEAKDLIPLKAIVAVDIALTDGCGEFTIPSTNLPNGKYPLTCQLLDAAGQELKAFSLTIRKVPQAEHDVILDADMNLLVDGKPFVVIEEYRSVSLPLPGAPYHLAKNGFNTVNLVGIQGTEQGTLEMLDQLHAVGLKAVMDIGPCFDLTPQSKERYKRTFLTRFTPKVRQHPALLAYYTCDEPLWGGLDYHPLIWTREFLHEIDPYHPVWINHAPRNEVPDLTNYGYGCDITGVDIYPTAPMPNGHCGLEDRSLNCVGAYTRRMSSTVFDRKPIWMILQAMSWLDHGNVHGDNNNFERRVYPTDDEMRFMIYDSFFNGCKGYSFYGTRTIKDKLYYDQFIREVGELRDVSGLLAQGKLGPDIPQDNDKVRVATCTWNGRTYYGILNKEPLHHKVKFPAPSKLEIYREMRQVAPDKDGFITLDLRPHETILCGAAPLPPPVYGLPAYDAAQEAHVNPALTVLRNANNLIPDPFAGRFYDSNANWIWDKNLYNVQCSNVVLTAKVTLDKAPTDAKFLYTCDDYAEIWINGQKVGSDVYCGWWILKDVDATKILHEGDNLIVAKANDTGVLPCGFFAELKLNGKVVMVSDNKWKARAYIEGEDLSKVTFDDNADNAIILAPYGEGAWGHQIELYKDGF